MSRSALVLAILAFIAVLASAQAPVPKRYDGYAQGPADAPLLFEVFGDFACPDTLAAWNTIFKPLIAHYGTKLRAVYHTFPLPYHLLSFDASQAAHVVETIKPGSFWPMADILFASQNSFENNFLETNTRTDAWNLFATYANQVGVSTTQFLNGMNSTDLNMDIRYSWKYGCSRTVSGTPSFYVNGVAVYDDYDFKQWVQFLDSLL